MLPPGLNIELAYANAVKDQAFVDTWGMPLFFIGCLYALLLVFVTNSKRVSADVKTFLHGFSVCLLAGAFAGLAYLYWATG